MIFMYFLVESVSQFFDDMQSCFTPKEWSVIYRGRSDMDKVKRFFLFWSLKESYIKAVGFVLLS
jgi:4'-phosphopantetheinyl transferase